jgi:DNA-binding transcriptional ArsR family regulator
VAKSEAGEPERTGPVDAARALGPQPLPELVEFRRITDAKTMKALGDPLRLRIMRVLGRDARIEPRIMTVKQVAEELGEPATKLYWHMKQLLAVDLIQIAELRLAGGIVEQHYRVAQAGWSVNPGQGDEDRDFLVSDDMFGMVDAAVEEYFTRYGQALRDGRTSIRSEDNVKNPPHVRNVGAIVECRVSQAKAAEFAERLNALVKEFAEETRGADGEVEGNLMAIFYATEAD